jgi:hypothetical protein
MARKASKAERAAARDRLAQAAVDRESEQDAMRARADLGPAVRRLESIDADGVVVMREGAGATIAGEFPDPTAPNRLVYQSRTAPPHARLLREGKLRPWHHEAAEQYARYWQLRELGRSPDPDAIRVHRQPWQRAGEMQAEQAEAAGKLRQARDVLGPLGEIAVQTVCVAELPLYRAYQHLFPMVSWPGQKASEGPSQPIKAAMVLGVLVTALDALARAWWLGPRRPDGGRAGAKRGAAT